jgi:hypothetical protein
MEGFMAKFDELVEHAQELSNRDGLTRYVAWELSDWVITTAPRSGQETERVIKPIGAPVAVPEAKAADPVTNTSAVLQGAALRRLRAAMDDLAAAAQAAVATGAKVACIRRTERPASIMVSINED